MKDRSTIVSRLSMILALVMLGAAPMALTGCNTTEGVGKDIEATGDAISDTARDAKD